MMDMDMLDELDIIQLAAYSRRYVVDMSILKAYLESLTMHIRFVRQAGKRLGVRDDLLRIHDQSKMSPREFPYYARHFYGGGDPDGFARAWLHHMNHNPHHWQHWIFPDGFTPVDSDVENGVVEMPQCYALEMIADWYGASMAYTGSWDMSEWLQKNIGRIRLHSRTTAFVRAILEKEGYGEVVLTHQFAHEIDNHSHS